MKKTIENAVLTATKVAYPVAVLNTKAAFLEGAELEEKIFADCKKAVADYFRYVPNRLNDVEENVTDRFFIRLALDYVYDKKPLRDFMRKSPAWNEDLQAWVINGNRTHEPNQRLIDNLVTELLQPAFGTVKYDDLMQVRRYFFNFDADEKAMAFYAETVQKLAPKANLRKSKSKVFGALCKALGIWQDSGDFQTKYSELCNELNAKKIDFKLIVSINPAHFLTMSNPHGGSKLDAEGFVIRNAAGRPIDFLTNGKKETMVSCHSLDSTGQYRNGAIGYARDSVTMIAFTVKDFEDKETLNYRKTSRQLFMYKVGNGVLLQSRLYDSERPNEESYGGVTGDEGASKSKLYRELIQREIAENEGKNNFWSTCKYTDNKFGLRIDEHCGFGGYADWLEIRDCAKISVLKDFSETAEGFTVGKSGVCLICGEETSKSENLLCDDCDDEDFEVCGHCGERHSRDEMTYIDDGGFWVCDNCCDEFYSYCEVCEEYHSNENVFEVDGRNICKSCLEDSEEYVRCKDCGEWVNRENSCWVGGDYNGYYVCESCIDNYTFCEHCEEHHRNDEMQTVFDAEGNTIEVCDDCRNSGYFVECQECGEVWHEDALKNGLCPHCSAEK